LKSEKKRKNTYSRTLTKTMSAERRNQFTLGHCFMCTMLTYSFN